MLKLNNSSLFRKQCYLNGQWVAANSKEVILVKNPATGETIGTVPRCGGHETRQAIRAAQQAFVRWREKTASERCRIVRCWFELMMLHQDDLARIMTLEQGKPLAEAKGEIAYAAAFLEWFSEEGKRAYGEVIPSPFQDRRLMTLREPVGVCAAITPWNFPSAMITRKAAPALVAGCSIVVKPAGQTPFSALALAELAAQAGVPAGVFNVITGSAEEIGAELTANPMVKKLSFTGSTEVGRRLMAQCAPTIKRLSLELGGNAPFIVFDDADLDAAVAGALASKYRNAGQTCVCSNRFFVQDGVHDAFAAKLVQAVTKLKVGNGLEEGVIQGPLINEDAVNKVEILLAEAVSKGARVLCGGKRLIEGKTWFEPTVLSGVTSDMAITHEEIFGPVAPLIRFHDEQNVIDQANNTEFGLAAYFYARDVGRIWRVSEQLEYGMVGINTGLISTEVAPFGGVKQSGIGREGSRHGLDEYMSIKYLAVGGM